MAVRQRVCYVADDEPGILNILSFAAGGVGYRVEPFERLDDIVRRAAVGHPDLIVLDLAMEGGDITAALSGLSGIGFRGSVMLMSGLGEPRLEEAQRAGIGLGLRMLPFLVKPFRPPDVRRILVSSGIGDARLLSQVEIEAAFREDRFELWYQPQIDLHDASVIGAEALVRLRHPEQGIVPPGAFLPALDMDQFVRLTEWVLHRAMTDWRLFSAAGLAPRLSINSPASILADYTFSDLVRAIVPRDPTWPGLVVEITETEMMDDVDLVYEIATQLRLHGIEISIDDFGTGYSSLARLRHVPFAEVKIDGSLVMGLERDEPNRIVVQAVAALCHHLNGRVVAEGIETREMLSAVRALGCDVGQGYLFSPALPPLDFIRWTHDWRVRSPTLAPAQLPDRPDAPSGRR